MKWQKKLNREGDGLKILKNTTQHDQKFDDPEVERSRSRRICAMI